MRKSRLFTPERLARWYEQGRGHGTLASYVPWHQVTRDDPGSIGRSHIVAWQRFDRLFHLLSDLELVGLAFVSMLTDLEDLREQFPLATKHAEHELLAYRSSGMPESLPRSPGSLAVASVMKIAHPQVRGKLGNAPWVLTSDLLITRRGSNRQLLAVSLKYDEKSLTSRQRDLLRLECEYWRQRDVPWLFITPRLFHPNVARSVREGVAWTVDQLPVPPWTLQFCSTHARSWHMSSKQQVIRDIADKLRIGTHDAQRVFWQSIWSGALPIDLTWASRVSDPVKILEPDAFWEQNPIVSGRSAWNH